MSTILANPKFMAFDDNGDPLSGGLVYTYLAGTTTAKASYSDRACTTANANPVVLDARGEATIYLKGKYKIVLKTAAGVAIWTIDGISGMGDWQEGAQYADYNETDQGVAGAGASMKDLVDAIAAENATLFLTHNSGAATTTYTLSTSLTIPSNINLKVEKGAKISVGAGKTLTINGNIEAGAYEIFTGTGTVAGSAIITEKPSVWVNSGLTHSMIGTLLGTPIRDKSRGLIIINTAATPNSKVDVDADEILLQDANNSPFRALSVNLTIDIAAAGANGLDTGAEAAATWYYIWVIYNGTTVAGVLSTSTTAPTLPAGYTYKALVGAIYNSAGSDFITMKQVGTRVSCADTNDATGNAVAYTGLTATIPTTAKKWRGYLLLSASGAGPVNGVLSNEVAGAVGAADLRGHSGAAGYYVSGSLELPLHVARTLYYKIVTGGGWLTDNMKVQTIGWDYE